jgi:hypothetical protein
VIVTYNRENGIGGVALEVAASGPLLKHTVAQGEMVPA